MLPCSKKVVIALPFAARDAFKYMRTSHLNLFMADVVLVPLWWIAFTVVVAVSVDALTDPLVATWADQLRTPCGRRRPLVAIGVILVSVFFAMLFMPCLFGLCPSDDEYGNLVCVDGNAGGVQGSWIWFMVFSLLYFLALDLVVVSLEAFAAELTPSYSDRSCMMGLLQVFSVIGILCGVVLPPLIAKDQPQTQFVYTAVGFGAYMIISGYIVVGCLKERGSKSFEKLKEKATKKRRAEDVEVGNPTIELAEVKQKAQDVDESTKQREPPKRKESTPPGDPEFNLDIFDLEEIHLDELEDNYGLVPGFISSFRNKMFRVLLISEVLESLGDQLAYTVLPFVVKYVIQPVDLGYSTTYAILAGTVLVFELISVPLWIYLSSRFGKWKVYVAWNLALTAGTLLKLIIGSEAEVGLAPTVVAAVAWGVSLGGSQHLLRSLVSDAIDYDELLSGQRREAQYMVFVDFLPKLAEVPSTVVPLMVMAAVGYEPNVVPQNSEVYWTILICFSAAPAFFTLLGALVLFWYPVAARNGVDCLDAVHGGIVKHAAGEDVFDPVSETVIAAPDRIREVIGGAHNESSMQHFYRYELQAVVKTKKKSTLIVHSALWILLYTGLAAGFIAASVTDWHTNIVPLLQGGQDVCLVVTQSYTNCAGYNETSAPCDACAPGFWGEDCASCPGLLLNDEGTGYLGSACNGQGTCNITDGTCECDARSGYSGPWCGVNLDNEPFTILPVYVALLGVWAFFIAFHSIRLTRAIDVTKDPLVAIDDIAAYVDVAFGRPLTPEERAAVKEQAQELRAATGTSEAAAGQSVNVSDVAVEEGKEEETPENDEKHTERDGEAHGNEKSNDSTSQSDTERDASNTETNKAD